RRCGIGTASRRRRRGRSVHTSRRAAPSWVLLCGRRPDRRCAPRVPTTGIARRPARAPPRRRAWRGRGSAFLARPPAVEELGGPFTAAQAKGEREREHHAREEDEEGLAHDVAADVHL